MKIVGFDGYIFKDNEVVSPSGKTLTKVHTKHGTYQYKMKRNDGKWTSVTESTLKSLTNNSLLVPSTAKEIPGYSGYFIDTDGTVYSFSRTYPDGKILNHGIDTKGYPNIKINKKKVSIHSLLAITFIMEDYVKKGLCCMHKDDNKLNCHLNNLAIGTYSQNNKDSYKRGCNPGNGLKKSM